MLVLLLVWFGVVDQPSFAGDKPNLKSEPARRVQLIEGWTKNLVLLFSSPVALACLRLAEFLIIWASGLLGIAALWYGTFGIATCMLALCSVLKLFFLRRILRAHFPWDSNLLAFYGLPFFAYLLYRSVIQYKRGQVAWKGRNYPGSPAA